MTFRFNNNNNNVLTASEERSDCYLLTIYRAALVLVVFIVCFVTGRVDDA